MRKNIIDSKEKMINLIRNFKKMPIKIGKDLGLNIIGGIDVNI